MIEAQRLSEILRPHGFELVWDYWLGQQFHYAFAKPSIISNVFEHIRIECAGKRGEVVWCEIVVTPLRSHEFQFKPAPRFDEVLTELTDDGSSRTEIKTVDAAKRWEQRVGEVAPERARSLAELHAATIGQATAVAQRAAQEYVKLVREFSDETILEYLAVQLSSKRAPEKGLADAFPGLMTSQDDLRDAEECATLAIATFGTIVDPVQEGFETESSRKTPEYKLRLALIADLLRNGG